MTTPSVADSALLERRDQIADDLQSSQRRATSRAFAFLMILQWVSAVAAAILITPRTWIGETSAVHAHVWLSLLGGGLLSAGPALLAWQRPDAAATRHVIAVAQMGYSSLLIHLTGGRIETHFHVFGSLAFLSFFADWRVLITASLVVVIDHALRAAFVPMSVFGIAAASFWRPLEHAGWVVFENVFLFFACRRWRTQWRQIAAKQAGLEAANAATEATVAARTAELVAVNLNLEENRAALDAANQSLLAAVRRQDELRDKLVSASRLAGRADVATCVLHNVGNVLNSVQVSAAAVADRINGSETSGVIRLGQMLARDQRLREQLSADPRGRQVCDYLVEAAVQLHDDRHAVAAELAALAKGVEHITRIIQTQQSAAAGAAVVEHVRPAAVADAALALQAASIAHARIHIHRDFEDLDPLPIDRHQVIQILTNLIANARDALAGTPIDRRRLALAVRSADLDGRPAVLFSVADNGSGIAHDVLPRIFEMGFTTKERGHGFGLHSAATSAQALGGRLTARSDGPGAGATFELVLPAGPPPPRIPAAMSSLLAANPS